MVKVCRTIGHHMPVGFYRGRRQYFVILPGAFHPVRRGKLHHSAYRPRSSRRRIRTRPRRSSNQKATLPVSVSTCGPLGKESASPALKAAQCSRQGHRGQAVTGVDCSPQIHDGLRIVAAPGRGRHRRCRALIARSAPGSGSDIRYNRDITRSMFPPPVSRPGQTRSPMAAAV